MFQLFKVLSKISDQYTAYFVVSCGVDQKFMSIFTGNGPSYLPETNKFKVCQDFGQYENA